MVLKKGERERKSQSGVVRKDFFSLPEGSYKKKIYIMWTHEPCKKMAGEVEVKLNNVLNMRPPKR